MNSSAQGSVAGFAAQWDELSDLPYYIPEVQLTEHGAGDILALNFYSKPPCIPAASSCMKVLRFIMKMHADRKSEYRLWKAGWAHCCQSNSSDYLEFRVRACDGLAIINEIGENMDDISG